MSGVWVFKNGVVRLVENVNDNRGGSSSRRRKVLLYIPTNEVVTSYATLERMLVELGWERYREDHPELIQFHRQHSLDLISLPRDFGRFRTVHMYDIVVKNRHCFRVVDA